MVQLTWKCSTWSCAWRPSRSTFLACLMLSITDKARVTLLEHTSEVSLVLQPKSEPNSASSPAISSLSSLAPLFLKVLWMWLHPVSLVLRTRGPALLQEALLEPLRRALPRLQGDHRNRTHYGNMIITENKETISPSMITKITAI